MSGAGGSQNQCWGDVGIGTPLPTGGARVTVVSGGAQRFPRPPKTVAGVGGLDGGIKGDTTAVRDTVERERLGEPTP